MKNINIEKLNLKKRRWKIKVFILFVSVIASFEGITYLIKPSIIALCKVRSESLATKISSSAVQEVMSRTWVFRFGNFRKG